MMTILFKCTRFLCMVFLAIFFLFAGGVSFAANGDIVREGKPAGTITANAGSFTTLTAGSITAPSIVAPISIYKADGVTLIGYVADEATSYTWASLTVKDSSGGDTLTFTESAGWSFYSPFQLNKGLGIGTNSATNNAITMSGVSFSKIQHIGYGVYLDFGYNPPTGGYIGDISIVGGTVGTSKSVNFIIPGSTGQIRYITNGTEKAALSNAGDYSVTGAIYGGAGTYAITGSEAIPYTLMNRRYEVSVASTMTLDTNANSLGKWMHVYVTAAVVCTITPQAGDTIYLNGTALTAGYSVISSGTAGDKAVVTPTATGIWIEATGFSDKGS